MPSGDRTGPGGEGPLTGKGLGYGGGYDQPGNQKDEGRPYDGRGGGLGNRPIRPPADDTTLDERVTGPGGHIPDGTGPHGRGAGPGKGMGYDIQGSLDSLYKRYPNSKEEVDKLIAESQKEATKQNLYGEKRAKYIADYVEIRIRAGSSDLPRGTIGYLVNEMVGKYAKGSDSESEIRTIKDIVSRYEAKAADKGYTGEKAREYIRSKVQEELEERDKGDEESDEDDASEGSSDEEKGTAKGKEDSNGESSESSDDE